jgi:hypothetical protein
VTDLAGQAADQALAAAEIARDAEAAAASAAEAARTAAESLKPDERLDPAWQLRSQTEQLGSKRTGPRKNRWRGLAELDQRIAELEARQAALMGRVTDLDVMLGDAFNHDRQQLAAWVEAGERGDPPAATAPPLEREREQTRLLIEAAIAATESVYDERVRYVERHRGRMAKQARAEVEDARGRYLHLIGELRNARADLLDVAHALRWVELFPSENAVASIGVEAHLCAGLLEPVRRLIGTTAQLPVEQILQAFTEDARVLTDRRSPEARRELGTWTPTPEIEAMWSDDPRAKEWGKQKLEQARGLAQFGDVDKLSEEVRDIRP